MAFSMAAEIERDLISQRTMEALRAKKAAGMKLVQIQATFFAITCLRCSTYLQLK